MRTIHHLQRAALLSSIAVIGACQPATHPASYATTIFDAVCHFQFNCCTPIERLETPLASIGATALDEGRCREELEDQAGGLFNVAAAAVDNGTAVFDAEAAERCTAAAREAMASCDSQTVLGSPRIDGGTVAFMIAPERECLLLARTAFTRGTVDNGGACTADVDCKDFGACAFLDADDEEVDGPARPATGVCQTPAGDGEACDERVCGFGLQCVDGDDGELVCREIEVKADGEACFSASECGDRSFCEATSGTCDDGSGDCDFDFECGGLDAICEGAQQVCAPLEQTDIEICDGL